MANSARNQPGTIQSERPLKDEEINPLTLGKLESFYEVNKKTISTVTTVILVVVVGYFAYTKLYKGPAEDKAATALAIPQLYFQADSLNMALNGDGNKNLGFIKIGKKYDGTAAGNLAHYYEGICYLRMGDYKNAIKALKNFNGKGTVVGSQAYGALGDAYMESGDNANAIESFKKATEDKEDGLITPMYLYHLGLAYEAGGKANEAKDAFKRIRDEYPKSMQARDMDKELARLGEVN
jgi:tetratricopeptide (TPR) repeat protein